MTKLNYEKLIEELRHEMSDIDGAEIVVRDHDIRFLHDGTDDEYEVPNFAALKKLVSAIKTLSVFRT